MTDAARSRYAPENPGGYFARVGTVAEALDDISTVHVVETVDDAVTLEPRSQLVFADGTSTITLPSVTTAIYQIIVVKNIGTGSVTVGSPDDVEGNATLVLSAGEASSLVSTGTTWRTL